MLNDEFYILNCRRLPAALSTARVAYLLGFHKDDIQILVKAQFLERLGKAKTGKMSFHRSVVEQLADDPTKMNEAKLLVEKKNKKKNTAKRKRVAAKKAAPKAKTPPNVIPMNPKSSGEDQALCGAIS